MGLNLERLNEKVASASTTTTTTDRAAAIAPEPTTDLSEQLQDARAEISSAGRREGRSHCEQASGGNARYHSASLEQKLALNGADPSLAKVPDSEIKRYMGKDSSATEASQAC